MQSFVFSAILLLLSATFSFAQQSADQRTVTTTVADILAKFPSDRQTQTDSLTRQLMNTGEAGLTELFSLFESPGSGNNTLPEYAVSALTAQVTKAGNEKQRQTLINALCGALKTAKHHTIGNFFVEQLQIVGDESAVDCLQAMLTHKMLSGPTARAMAQFNAPAGNQLLLSALSTASNDARLSILESLGYVRYQAAAPVIESAYNSYNAREKKVALQALAKIGAPSSLSILKAAAKEKNYMYDSSDATAALFKYITRLSENGEKQKATAAVDELAKEIPADQMHARIAALDLLVTLTGEKAIPVLMKTMNEQNVELRAAALAGYNKYADGEKNKRLLTTVKRASPEVQAQVIDYLATTGDKGLLAELKKLTKNKNKQVREAAISASAQLGGESAVPVLMEALRSGDTAAIGFVKAELLTLQTTNIGPLLTANLDKMPSAAKAAIVEVLAARHADNAGEKVFSLVNSTDTLVQNAAIRALPSLAGQQELPQLFTLLKTVEPRHVPYLQDAIIAGSRSMDTAEQTAAIRKEMSAAGKDQQHLYLPLLASAGGEDAISALRDAYRSGSKKEKEIIIEAVSENADRRSAEMLGEISRTATDELKNEALNGYLNVISKAPYSPDEKTTLLQEAMPLATTVPQKKKIIQAAGHTRTLESLVFAGKYMDDPALEQTAVMTVYVIALNTPSYTQPEVRTLLEKAATLIKGPDSEYQKEAIRKHLSDMQSTGGSPVYELTDEEKAAKFRILFDGTHLNEWVGNKTDYVVEKGEIHVNPSGSSHNGNLYTKDEFADFIFRFEFKLTPGANNGLGIRTPMEGDAAYVGMELQILDNEADIYKNLKPYQYHGSVYGVLTAKRGFLKPVGEWNDQEVEVKGTKIKVTLNGEVILNGDIKNARDKGTLDKLDHPGLKRKKGHIGFLGHGSQLWLRNIRVKTL